MGSEPGVPPCPLLWALTGCQRLGPYCQGQHPNASGPWWLGCVSWFSESNRPMPLKTSRCGCLRTAGVPVRCPMPTCSPGWSSGPESHSRGGWRPGPSAGPKAKCPPPLEGPPGGDFLASSRCQQASPVAFGGQSVDRSKPPLCSQVCAWDGAFLVPGLKPSPGPPTCCPGVDL